MTQDSTSIRADQPNTSMPKGHFGELPREVVIAIFQSSIEAARRTGAN